MGNCFKKSLKKFIDNKLPDPEEPTGCPEVIQALIKLIHSAMNGFFIFQWISSFFVKNQETLAVFCFPHSSDGVAGQAMFWASGVSAFLELFTSFGHFFILCGHLCECLSWLTKIRDWWFFKFSVRTYLAIAVFNATWVEQVSVSCANPDSNSGAYIFDFKNELWLSLGTLFSLITGVLNFLVSGCKGFPARKKMKRIRPLNFVAQALFFGFSVFSWFGKFYDGSDATFWMVLVWWVSRFIQFGYTEICKCCKKREGEEEEKEEEDSDVTRSFNRNGEYELQENQNSPSRRRLDY